MIHKSMSLAFSDTTVYESQIQVTSSLLLSIQVV